MRPAGGITTFGSLSGANPWQFDWLFAETSAGAATVRAAAGISAGAAGGGAGGWGWDRKRLIADPTPPGSRPA